MEGGGSPVNLGSGSLEEVVVLVRVVDVGRMMVCNVVGESIIADVAELT